jgi:hypothetical protein
MKLWRNIRIGGYVYGIGMIYAKPMRPGILRRPFGTAIYVMHRFGIIRVPVQRP